MFEWIHLAIAVISVMAGALGGLLAGVWRVAQIEGRLKLHFQRSISECEKRFEEKVDRATEAFDETLKGLRQKINDVELETVKGFVAKGDFDDFRAEYREDMRDLKNSIAQIPRSH
jgi:hypothetical protein